jgi:Na+-transporting NADH:ubiquinone oxidoreductase subunit B
MLIPLILPPTIPLWMVAVGTAFAVIIGKEVFGGTGMNLLNPALTARVFLFFAYPAEMSGDMVWIAEKADSYSGATILGNAAQGIPTEKLGFSFMDAVMGVIPGSIGETSVIMCLIGALILIVSGIGSWRIMIATILGGLSMGLLLNVIGTSVSETSTLSAGIRQFMLLPAHWHLVIGGFMFGTVFMATDPVSASQTTTGKYIYGFLIGLFTILIRVFNPAYPEGMMLAILLMNVFAPLIDFYVIQANKNRRLKRATL